MCYCHTTIQVLLLSTNILAFTWNKSQCVCHEQWRFAFQTSFSKGSCTYVVFSSTRIFHYIQGIQYSLFLRVFCIGDDKGAETLNCFVKIYWAKKKLSSWLNIFLPHKQDCKTMENCHILFWNCLWFFLFVVKVLVVKEWIRNHWEDFEYCKNMRIKLTPCILEVVWVF